MQPSNITFDFADDPIYTIAYEISGLIAGVCGLTSMFLIWKKSPTVFGPYKYFLFNIAFWSFVFDIHMTVFYQPKPLFPALLLCQGGIFKSKSLYLATVCLVRFKLTL